MSDTFVKVADTADVPEGQARVYTIDGLRLAVCNVAGAFHVVADICTHDDGPLGEGHLDGHAIQCPRHGARFDVRSGAVLSMPAAYPVKAYQSRVVDGVLEVDLGGAG